MLRIKAIPILQTYKSTLWLVGSSAPSLLQNNRHLHLLLKFRVSFAVLLCNVQRHIIRCCILHRSFTWVMAIISDDLHANSSIWFHACTAKPEFIGLHYFLVLCSFHFLLSYEFIRQLRVIKHFSVRSLTLCTKTQRTLDFLSLTWHDIYADHIACAWYQKSPIYTQI